MKKKLLSLWLAALILLLVACGTSDSTGSIESPEPDGAAIAPDNFTGELTLDFYFGTHTGNYSGTINKQGLPDGYGTFSSEGETGESWTYAGEWVDGHLEGTGTTTWSDGMVYTGDFSLDERSGRGIYTFSTGDRYEGGVASGNFSGAGVYYYADGTRFAGSFKDTATATGTFLDNDDVAHKAYIEYGELVLVVDESVAGEEVTTTVLPESAPTSEPEPSPTETVSMGQRNALSAAKNYLSFMAFSYSGLIEQLKFEGYTTEEATYGADNCGADWNEQAAKKAQEYLDFMSFSRQGLIDQLKFEGFTASQAEYGVSAVGY